MKPMFSLWLAILFLWPSTAAASVPEAAEAVAVLSDPCSLDRPEVPDSLQPPEGHCPLLRAAAEGVQIYQCQVNPAGQFEWVFQAPEAGLFEDEEGESVGRHLAGPTWEARDGSRVVGQVAAAPAPDPEAIPWLLLRAVAHEGDGTFSAVTYVQRLDTTGGRAPAQGCDGAHVGDVARVDYTANYYFYIATNP